MEWALYRLLELWDPDETREKLQPFFPPLEPLQSLNLRAALFRCLDQLKKNGVLGRECMLRKTMLDECKGEKLMEVLVLFSTAVLRRVETRKQNGRQLSISMRLAASPMLNAARQGSLLPLSLAIRADLSRMLRVRGEKKARCENFSELLGHKDQQLRQRMTDCQKPAKTTISGAEEAAIKNQVHSNWPGRSKWTDVVLQGDEVNPGDLPLKRPFNEVWSVIANGGSLHASASDTGLLANLEQRVRMQKERLSQWQTFHEKIATMMGPIPSSTTKATEEKPAHAVVFHFNKHQGSHLSHGKAAGDVDPNQASKPTISSPYDTIIEKMKKDIVEASKIKKEAAPRKTAAPTVEFESARKSTSDKPRTSDLQSRTLKADEKPCRSPQNRAKGERGNAWSNSMSERSTSISSIFSPAKLRNASEQPESPKDISITDILGLDKLQLENKAPDASPGASASTPEDPPKSRQVSEEVNTNGSKEDEDPAAAIVSSVLHAAPTPVRPIPLSLAERTRMSIANVKPLPQSPLREEVLTSSNDEDPDSPEPEFDRRASLLDRTRQSMSRLPAQPAVRSKKPITAKRRPSSMMYPINQFETPGRSQDVPIRNSTPTEKLFSPDAEYASVFKSRPKVALSPVFSPDDDSTLPAIDSTSELDESSLDNVLSNSSPLAARIFSAQAK